MSPKLKEKTILATYLATLTIGAVGFCIRSDMMVALGCFSFFAMIIGSFAHYNRKLTKQTC